MRRFYWVLLGFIFLSCLHLSAQEPIFLKNKVKEAPLVLNLSLEMENTLCQEFNPTKLLEKYDGLWLARITFPPPSWPKKHFQPYDQEEFSDMTFHRLLKALNQG